MSCADWFGEWLQIHILKHPKARWPEYGTPDGDTFYDGYLVAFDKTGMTKDEAFAVSIAMQAEKPCFLDGMLHRILEKLQLLREIEGKQNPPVIDRPRGQGQCLDCGGHGFTTRYVHNKQRRECGYGFTCFCTCEQGRQYELTYRATPEIHRRIYDLCDPKNARLQRQQVSWTWLEDGCDNQFRYHPSQWDEELGRPKPVEVGTWRRGTPTKKDGDITILGGAHASSPPPKPSPLSATPSTPQWQADIRSALAEPLRARLDALSDAERRRVFDGITVTGLPTDDDIAKIRLRLRQTAASAPAPVPPPPPSPEALPPMRSSPPPAPVPPSAAPARPEASPTAPVRRLPAGLK